MAACKLTARKANGISRLNAIFFVVVFRCFPLVGGSRNTLDIVSCVVSGKLTFHAFSIPELFSRSDLVSVGESENQPEVASGNELEPSGTRPGRMMLGRKQLTKMAHEAEDWKLGKNKEGKRVKEKRQQREAGRDKASQSLVCHGDTPVATF